MALPTLRDVLAQPLPEPNDKTPKPGSPSKASMTANKITSLRFMNISAFKNGLQEEDAARRLMVPSWHIGVAEHRVVHNEADVCRLAYEYLTHPVSLAFPEIQQRSEYSEESTRVDTIWSVGDKTVAVMEFKRYGTLKSEEWSQNPHNSAQQLGRQIRRYGTFSF